MAKNKMGDRKMKKHLKKVNMNYFQHMYLGWKIGQELILSFITIIVHSINPAWFEYSTSKRIKKLHNKIIKKR